MTETIHDWASARGANETHDAAEGLEAMQVRGGSDIFGEGTDQLRTILIRIEILREKFSVLGIKIWKLG
jgi:hypothetical protein